MAHQGSHNDLRLNVEADVVAQAPWRPYTETDVEFVAERCPGCGRQVVLPCLACAAEEVRRFNRNMELLDQ